MPNEAHGDNEPDILMTCFVCSQTDDDVVQCVVDNCIVYAHKSCVNSCDGCGGVLCSDHEHAVDDLKVCHACLPETLRLWEEDQQELRR